MIDSITNHYVLNGPKLLKKVILGLAMLLLAVSLAYVTILKVAVLFPVFISGVFLVTIQFHRMTINQYELIVEKHGLVKWLNIREEYPLKEITSIQFAKGTPVAHVMVNQTIFRSSGYGPRSQADKLILNLKGGKQKFINRISSRKKFLNLCTYLDSRLVLKPGMP